MLRIMLEKLMSKKWMNLCLLLGSILLIATVVSFPLYQTAAYDRMLRDEFQNALTDTGEWPAMLEMSVVSKKEAGGKTINRLEELNREICGELGVTQKQIISYYLMYKQDAHSTMNRTDVAEIPVRIGAMSELPGHAEIISGEMFSESGLTEDGSIEVVVSQSALVGLNLLVGETIRLDDLRDAEGKEIRLYIKGVFRADDNSDFYWQIDPDAMDNVCMMNIELFRQMFTGENAQKYTMNCRYYALFEYGDLTSAQVEGLLEKTKYYTEESAYKGVLEKPSYQDTLSTYLRKQGRIQATLTILQIPVLIMLGAFLFMISGQMYEMERNEISVIKSRGSSGAQIFRLYLYQSTFLAVVGGILGVGLGAVFSQILGSAKSFLEFDSSRTLVLTFNRQVWIYAGASVLATLLIMTLPAIRHSRVTIVKLKQQKALKKKSWWEKIFLDVILLGVSLYGYYSFRKSADSLAESVLSGQSLDPLLYVSSSLFIVGLGLLFLRLQPLLVQLIYLIGKKRWSPAGYASFMEIIKNGRKQQFIMLFLIMTISLGMYHATVARTILQNAKENVEYLDGADIVIREVWAEIRDMNGASTGNYIEPDYSKYAELGCADKYTKVFYDEKAYIGTGKTSRQSILLMGIHTKNFGMVTWVPTELMGRPYYEYLNELAVAENGILVSENFRSKLGYEVGDSITYYNNKGMSATGKIVDFFSYWPGYAPTVTDLNPDGTAYTEDQYLVVTHYDLLRQKWGTQPYEVWIGLKEDADPGAVYDWIQKNDVKIKKFIDRASDVKAAVEDPLLQGTNGVLTMGFVVTILLCAVGYLIYWIMSIRSREMIFGVLRACGMHKGELIHMLLNEQLFSGVLSVGAGIGIGRLTSVMFVPMLQRAYAAANQVLPMELVINASDMMRLYGVIACVMLICLVTLILLLFKMNVTKALKLGEE